MSTVLDIIESSQEIVSCDAGYKVKRFKHDVVAGRITALQHGETSGPIAHLGQKVFSNGRFAATKGTMGIVVDLKMPYENGKTGDVIVVWFENHQAAKHMKFHDLEQVQVGRLEDLKYRMM